MTEAIIYARVEPDFLLRDYRMLNLSFEAKGLYLCLWTSLLDKNPRTEILSWASAEQMLYVLAGYEKNPDQDKVARLLLEIEEQGLIQLGTVDENGVFHRATNLHEFRNRIKRIKFNFIFIPGFKAKHPNLNWRSNRGRKPNLNKTNYLQEPQPSALTTPVNFPTISHELPDDYPTISHELPDDFPTISPKEKKRKEKKPPRNSPPHAQNLPANPLGDASKDSSFTALCSIERTTEALPKQDAYSSLKSLTPLTQGKRAITPEMRLLVASVYELLVKANGENDASYEAAAQLLMRTIGLKRNRAELLLQREPEAVCRALLSALTEANKPAALLVQHLLKGTDLRDSPIYDQTKSLIFGGQNGRVDV